VATDAEKITRLEREIEERKAENERLRRALEEALRSAKRQAAPFSRRHPKAHPQKPGRKAGAKYGRRGRRKIPEKVDETVEVPLPQPCPQCGGRLKESELVSQYQTEIPEPRVERIEFRIPVGHCRQCGERVQGRHPRQTSQAVGSAASQLGARALALATYLNKGLGLPYGKTAALLEEAFGLRVSRGGLCQGLARMARKAAPTYAARIQPLRGSPRVTPDETGWKVGGRLWWMWAFSTPQITVYCIQDGRGLEPAAWVLGADYAGFLVRDGWSVDRQFVHAYHQTCRAHRRRRCREMRMVQGPKASRFPLRVQSILEPSLHLRDRYAQEQISPRGLAAARGRLEARMDRLLQANYRRPENQRFANHLRREQDALFSFLHCPGLDATNWRAEQAIRPMVVTRKVWGGNRTTAGARTQGILVSICKPAGSRVGVVPRCSNSCYVPHSPRSWTWPLQHAKQLLSG
jgi:transposase